MVVENKTQRYESYKESGVEWLGEIPLNWNLQKLKSFLTVHGRIGFRGYTVNDLVSKDEGAVTISPSNMGENNMIWDKVSYLSWQKYYESPEIIVEEGDLLIVKTASVGKIAYVRELKEKATINPQILILKNVKINKDFFYYQLLSRVFQHQLETEKIGSTIYTISETKILNFRAIIPPLSEQTKIAQFLDDKTTKIDDAIAIKEQQISLLKERKQILIHKAVTRGLDDSVTLKDSGVEWIGAIPEHWEVKRLKYVFKILKRIAGELGHEVLSITQKGIKVKDVESGGGQLSMDYSKYQIVNKGDFAMNHMDLLTGYVDISKYEGVISPDYRVFNLIHNSCDKYYILLLLQLGYRHKIFYAHGQGVSMLGRWRFPADNFNNFRFPIPPLSEQKEISDYIETASQKIETAIGLKQQEIEKLKEYKSSLINSVVTGKVRVC
ncbi:restriction endonuclease subunit S [Cellulophaga baltica]|uniref:Type I restriction modification DNA specificity domain-containing protein n=1 Tax=Cellulophaga baltica 18 TaxID=1348584 RepID=A0AAU8RQ11_9FLAO|nr:restriction endonuclease subunit S [Cellulophaga baltica]AIZ42708.1 hypothetical protein M666_14695 [Cellulophaga baltica 18]